MDFNILAQTRYSVRKFQNKTVEPELLEKVLKAGRLAPTSHNSQPQQIFVLKSKESRKKAAQCTPCLFNAPIIMLICYDINKTSNLSINNVDFGLMDVSIIATHMMLEAADIGLGTTWVGYFDESKTRSIFNLPECLVPVAFMPLGYAASDCQPHEYHQSRRPLTETVNII